MKFDYLIIGAGSAGCVLANRLSANNQNNVAVFEAGKPSDIWKVNMPLAILYTMPSTKQSNIITIHRKSRSLVALLQTQYRK